jgi:BON domain
MKSGHLFLLAAISIATPAFAQDQTTAAVQKALHSDAFRQIHASVDHGTVTLNGAVDLYSTKFLTERQVSRVHGIVAIRDEVQVGEPTLPDRELHQRLIQAITFSAVQCLGHLPDPASPFPFRCKMASSHSAAMA